MPPKSKGAGKKPAKVKTPTLIDGLTKDEMTKEQMEEHIVRLREELDREREERNYFQLERDKIHTFWEVTDRKLEEVKAELKNLDKDLEEDERRHQVEIKVYKQKMKHLLCEHQNTISEVKAHDSVSTEVIQKEQQQLETELHKKMRDIMVDMQELDSENLVKELELKHKEEITEMRNNCEKQLKEVKAKYDKKMELLPQELDNIWKNETSAREDNWNSYVNTLVEDHNSVLSEMKALVKEMNKDQKIIISILTQVEKKKASVEQKEKDIIPILKENKRHAKLLSKAQQENAIIEKKMKYPVSTELDVATEKVKKKELNDLKWVHEALEQKFSKLQLERNELYKTFPENIHKLQQKAGVKSTLLERELEALTENREKTQAQLNLVLSAPNMDQTALREVTSKTEAKLESSNNTIKKLQYKKAQISVAHKDFLLTYESKQRAVGVPVEEPCVKPFESSLSVKNLEQDLGLGFAPK